MTIQTKAIEQYFQVVQFAVHGGSNSYVCGWNPNMWPFYWKLLSSKYFHVVLFIMLDKVVLTFKSMDETLVCDHSDESY